MQLHLILATVGLAASAASAAQAQTIPAKPHVAVAVSADRFGVQADYRSPGFGQGYAPSARHVADCLATLRSYNPRTDRFIVRPGVSRRCTL